MIYVRTFSDIHNETFAVRSWKKSINANDRTALMNYSYEISQLSTDPDTVLILAGDIWDIHRGVEYANHLSPRFKAIIYVPGNHEYYDHCVVNSIKKLKVSPNDNVHLLNNGNVIIDGVNFVGSTFWTDINNMDQWSCYRAKTGMNDYRHIFHQSRRLSPEDTAVFNREARKKIPTMVDSTARSNILITHHAPHFSVFEKLMCRPFGGQGVDYCFWNTGDECLQIASQFDYWMFGHVHLNGHVKLGNTQYITNCVGYPNEDGVVPDDDGFLFNV